VPRAPRFLLALDYVTNDEQGWQAHCPICDCEGMTINPDRHRALWIFSCPDGCGHEEIERWLQADTRMYPEQSDDEYARLWMCFMLAPTIEICEALLRGEEVVDSRLDQTWLKRFRAAGIY
jgi:hypothetical protein